MIQMMLSIGGEGFARRSHARTSTLVRKMFGLSIVGSGFAVLAAQGLQHLSGG
ncbi:hypothetical protein [Paraburkholderia sp. BL10I2N1]|uniref:hypothetical protein n=1 Tax=Paraburkholderia sp. BL10I2N1 TaxID=1938796 RepID=UPI0010D749ED|nr:hypothetical protein [Paraburkholderia sp. BL10I2N1]TDN67517.1 hypothetical protein B0G77_0797 [Paraburkholderia sp. BL10I2N1]